MPTTLNPCDDTMRGVPGRGKALNYGSVLRWIKSELDRQLSDAVVRDVVFIITVPNTFGRLQRRTILAAATRAGYLAPVDDGHAAALDYHDRLCHQIVQQQTQQQQKLKTVLMLVFGASSLSLTVVEIAPDRSIQVLVAAAV